MQLQNSGDNNKKGTNRPDRLTAVLFIIYLVALCWILMFKLGVRFSYMENRRINLIPFRKFLFSNGKIDTGETILNIIIFIPLGIYTGILFKRRLFRNKILLFFSISLLFEVLQFIFRAGAFDITDIITNTSGGLIGLLLFELTDKIFNNTAKTQKFINIIAVTGTVLIISLLLLLKLNMLPVRYQ